MKTKQILALAGVLLGFQIVAAQAEYQLGGFNFSGSIFPKGQYVSGGAENSAQFNKFRDISDGATGDIKWKGEASDYELEFSAFDIGRKDQAYRLSGGNFKSYDWQLFMTDTINHKATVGVKGPWSNIGGTNLTILPGVDARNTLNDLGTGFTPFEYSVKRRNYGAKVNLLKDSPYYASLGYNQERQTGIKVLSTTPLNSSTTSTAIEIPEPMDYMTRNATLDVGYKFDQLQVSADGFYSHFGREDEFLYWDTPFANYQREKSMLAQPNSYWNGNVKATYRKLPLDSTVMAKAGYSHMTSKFDLLTKGFLGLGSLNYSKGASGSRYNTTVVDETASTDATEFAGKIEYMTGNLTVASHPLENVDTELHYGFLKKVNSSPRLTWYDVPLRTNTGVAPGILTGNGGFTGPKSTEGFGYNKHILGVDVGYKLSPSTKLAGAYEYMRIAREVRQDAEKTYDNKYTLGVTNQTMDWLTTHMKYSYLNRSAFIVSVFQNTIGYDVSPKGMHTASIEFDAEPMHDMEAALGYTYNLSRYSATTLDTQLPGVGTINGRQREWSHTATADVGYKFNIFKVSAFGEAERAYVESRIAQGSGSDTTAANPAMPYNTKTSDVYYTGGTAINFPLLGDALDTTIGYQYHRGNGRQEWSRGSNTTDPNNFTTLVQTGSTIANIDDYKKHALDAKVAYKLEKNLTLKGGYIFEQLRYSDAGYDNYQYMALAGNNMPSAYTGANADNSFTAHVGWAGVEYTF